MAEASVEVIVKHVGAGAAPSRRRDELGVERVEWGPMRGPRAAQPPKGFLEAFAGVGRFGTGIAAMGRAAVAAGIIGSGAVGAILLAKGAVEEGFKSTIAMFGAIIKILGAILTPISLILTAALLPLLYLLTPFINIMMFIFMPVYHKMMTAFQKRIEELQKGLGPGEQLGTAEIMDAWLQSIGAGFAALTLEAAPAVLTGVVTTVIDNFVNTAKDAIDSALAGDFSGAFTSAAAAIIIGAIGIKLITVAGAAVLGFLGATGAATALGGIGALMLSAKLFVAAIAGMLLAGAFIAVRNAIPETMREDVAAGAKGGIKAIPGVSLLPQDWRNFGKKLIDIITGTGLYGTAGPGTTGEKAALDYGTTLLEQQYGMFAAGLGVPQDFRSISAGSVVINATSVTVGERRPGVYYTAGETLGS